jgi:PBSX family phage terminase large subunit
MTTLADHIISKFEYILADAFAPDGHTEFWLKGGRGSTKSSFVSLCIIMLVMAFPETNAVIIRRYSTTLRDSVFNQMLWTVATLELQDWFQVRMAPMELTYLPTGQKIVFRGMDDPLKMKGVKFTHGYCAIQWFEEIDQIESWDKVSSALRSFRRGGDRFWTFYSYNPPRVAWSWVNEKAIEMQSKPTCLVDHSTYLDVLEGGHLDWLGEQFVEDAEYERERNPQHYQWEFLGEVTGTGGSVFENLKAVTLSDEQIATFDNHRNGVDWGWFPDPWRFVRSEWQPGNSRLIIFDEASANKKTPQETSQIVMSKLTYADVDGGKPYFHWNERVLCDDANPGDIYVYNDAGIKAYSAEKGNMRHASYLFLAGLREIWIDPERCPLTWREFSLCEYAKDRDGNYIDDFPDGNDHSIDAVRYSVMEEVRRGVYGERRSYDGLM